MLKIRIYTILKAPVLSVVSRHLFTNNPSQLFQINLLHAYKWRNGGPAQARRPRATTLAQTRHAGLLTVLKAPVLTVVPRHLFTNNPSQLFQINLLHAYR
jgi:hypothetical protein